jgi:hypothetical protein
MDLDPMTPSDAQLAETEGAPDGPAAAPLADEADLISNPDAGPPEYSGSTTTTDAHEPPIRLTPDEP